MEKENREVIENAEQKEDDSVKGNGKDRKKDRKWFTRIKAYIKKHPYRILAVILLCIALFFVLRETGVISKHVYEEVENLGEREGVCFDNLLFTYRISIYDNGSEKFKIKYLCIFNTGDVYCFEWSESYWWYEYDLDDTTNWEKAENVVYLGRFSNRDISLLNQYVKDFDIDGGRYLMPDAGEWPNGGIEGAGENRQNQVLLNQMILKNQQEWINYGVYIFQCDQQGESKGTYEALIESCTMNHLFGNIYEKGKLSWKSYEENALAAIELFESSLFYYRWVYMCLHN